VCASADAADALEAAVVKFQVALHRPPLRAVMPHLAVGGRKPRAIYSAEIATAKRAWRRELARRRAGSHVHVRRLHEYRRLLGRRQKELALRSGHHAVAIARASMCAFWKTCWRAEGRKAKSVPGITLEQWHDYFRDLLDAPCAPRRVRREHAATAAAGAWHPAALDPAGAEGVDLSVRRRATSPEFACTLRNRKQQWPSGDHFEHLAGAAPARGLPPPSHHRVRL
jgi:hypothetical protein